MNQPPDGTSAAARAASAQKPASMATYKRELRQGDRARTAQSPRSTS